MDYESRIGGTLQPIQLAVAHILKRLHARPQPPNPALFYRERNRIIRARHEAGECDLQQRVQSNTLASDQKVALATVLNNLYQLAQAESLRDSGGRQQDMFSGIDKADFSAWVRPMNQPTLF